MEYSIRILFGPNSVLIFGQIILLKVDRIRIVSNVKLWARVRVIRIRSNSQDPLFGTALIVITLFDYCRLSAARNICIISLFMLIFWSTYARSTTLHVCVLPGLNHCSAIFIKHVVNSSR